MGNVPSAATGNTASPTDPAPLSRRWFGGVFSTCGGGLIFLKLALDLFGWHGGGVLYWLIAAPLFIGFVASGIPWVVLSLRHAYRSRRRLWAEGRAWLLVLVGTLAAACTVVVVGSWLT
jgi:hypothetical protein